MRRIRLPARLAAADLARQGIAQPQGRNEFQRLGDQPEHPAVRRVIGDAELALHRAQRQRGLAIAQRHHHHRRVIGLRPAEQRFAQQPETAMGEDAARGRVIAWGSRHGGRGSVASGLATIR